MLQAQRTASDRLILTYTSQRKLRALAIGIAKRLGKRFNEVVNVEHDVCMNKGADSCQIAFQTAVIRPIVATAKRVH